MARINLTGPSGMGKTTLAKWISEEYNIPFVSGSYSDLVPETAAMPHKDMIAQDAKLIQEQDTKVVNLRKKAFNKLTTLVSDRSYLDSAAYFINKLSHRIPQCEVEHFIEICRELTLTQCDKIIFIPADTHHLHFWSMEDNHKRSTNLYFHIEISLLISWLIDLWGGELLTTIHSDGPVDAAVVRLTGQVYDQTYHTDILIIDPMIDTLKYRQEVVDQFLRM